MTEIIPRSGGYFSAYTVLQRQREKGAGIPLSISPNKQHADEKWEHKQAGESRMCSPRSENVPLWSETIFSERES